MSEQPADTALHGHGRKALEAHQRPIFETSYLLEIGRDVLLYRVTASRLLAKVLGEDADVMAESDFQSP